MRKLFDARCDKCGHVDEVFGELSDTFRCAQDGCDGVAGRIITPINFHLEGVSGSFPGAAMKWERDRTKRGGNS